MGAAIWLLASGIHDLSHDNQGLSLAKLDAEAETNSVVSERSWLIEMKAREDLVAAPTFTEGFKGAGISRKRR